ncbi:MAG: hypothetical protein CMI54_08570 [Parcubacteria group bacterium]|nr:hypothetical protein [Parcubacteria group bacterium]|tara:strand:- start:10978 stop:11205 length:228 start_codon:yes stop_codon:yes gene_type:complete
MQLGFYKFVKSRKGLSVMGVVVGIILLVAAALPVAQDVVDNSTATGTTRTIINLVPLFIAIAAIVFVARGTGLSE